MGARDKSLKVLTRKPATSVAARLPGKLGEIEAEYWASLLSRALRTR